MSDYKGAASMLPAMPKAKQLLADKGYDADWFRAALAKRRIAACIPSKSNRKIAIPHDPLLYKQRHRIENMFGPLKDWRRVNTQYVAPTPTSRQSASPQPSSSGSGAGWRPGWMTKPYSMDLRNRVVAAVESGGMSRNQAAARYGVAVSSAVKVGGAFPGDRKRRAGEDGRI
jgi:transposase